MQLTTNFCSKIIFMIIEKQSKVNLANKLFLEYSLFRIGQSLWILISIYKVNRIFSSAFLFILFSLWQRWERQSVRSAIRRRRLLRDANVILLLRSRLVREKIFRHRSLRITQRSFIACLIGTCDDRVDCLTTQHVNCALASTIFVYFASKETFRSARTINTHHTSSCTNQTKLYNDENYAL